MTTMIVNSPRRASMGRARLGDAAMYSWPPPGGYQPQPVEQVTDLDRDYGVGEVAALMQNWSADQAKKAYGVYQLVRSIRTKMSWVGKFASFVAADPTILGQFRVAQGGDQFIASAQGMSQIALKMDQPHLLTTLNNIVTALEVNILPAMGIGVRGRMPIINPVDFTQLSYVDTNTSAGKPDVIDFGDLSRTSLEGDVAALKLASDDISLTPPAGLGVVALLGIPAAILAKYLFILLLTTIIAGTVIIVTNRIFSSAKEGFNDVMKDPSWQSFIVALAKTNPDAAAKLVAGGAAGRDVLGDVTDLVKWGAIGGLTILIGGTIWYFATNR